MAAEKTEKKKKKGFFQEFKEFIARGNILDLAVGVIVGGAFSKIVTALVNDIIMPLVSLVMGGKSLNDLVLVLNGEPQYIDGVANPAAILWRYGDFIQTIIDFLITALVVFIFLKVIMKAKAAGEALQTKTAELAAAHQAAKEAEKAAAEAKAVAEEVKAEAEEAKAPAQAPAEGAKKSVDGKADGTASDEPNTEE